MPLSVAEVVAEIAACLPVFMKRNVLKRFVFLYFLAFSQYFHVFLQSINYYLTSTLCMSITSKFGIL